MIVKDKTDAATERHKAKLGLSGDVYILDGKYVESLESHRLLIPNSQALNIVEAEAERIAYELEQEQLREQQKEEPIEAEEGADG